MEDLEALRVRVRQMYADIQSPPHAPFFPPAPDHFLEPEQFVDLLSEVDEPRNGFGDPATDLAAPRGVAGQAIDQLRRLLPGGVEGGATGAGLGGVVRLVGLGR